MCTRRLGRSAALAGVLAAAGAADGSAAVTAGPACRGGRTVDGCAAGAGGDSAETCAPRRDAPPPPTRDRAPPRAGVARVLTRRRPCVGLVAVPARAAPSRGRGRGLDDGGGLSVVGARIAAAAATWRPGRDGAAVGGLGLRGASAGCASTPRVAAAEGTASTPSSRSTRSARSLRPPGARGVRRQPPVRRRRAAGVWRGGRGARTAGGAHKPDVVLGALQELQEAVRESVVILVRNKGQSQLDKHSMW